MSLCPLKKWYVLGPPSKWLSNTGGPQGDCKLLVIIKFKHILRESNIAPWILWQLRTLKTPMQNMSWATLLLIYLILIGWIIKMVEWRGRDNEPFSNIKKSYSDLRAKYDLILLSLSHTHRLVSFQKDLRTNHSHSNTNIRHSNTWFSPLKLIYIISSIYKPKSSILNIFCSCIK